MVTMASGPTKLNVAILCDPDTCRCNFVNTVYAPPLSNARTFKHTYVRPSRPRIRTPPLAELPYVTALHRKLRTTPRTRPLLLPYTPLCPPPRASPLSAALHHPNARLSPPHAARTEAPAIARPPCPCRLRPRLSYAPSPARAAAASASIPQPNRAACARLSESIALVAFAPRRSNRVATARNPARPRGARPQTDAVSSCRKARPLAPAVHAARPPCARNSPPASLRRPRPRVPPSPPPPAPFFLPAPPHSHSHSRLAPTPAPHSPRANRVRRSFAATSRAGTGTPRRRDPLRGRDPAAALPVYRARPHAASRRVEPPVLPRCREHVQTARGAAIDAKANANAPYRVGRSGDCAGSPGCDSEAGGGGRYSNPYPPLSLKPRRRSLRSHAAALSEAAADADLDGGI
ncbi:hypothetical protein B0H15DRAFT_1019747 [Mycena belliarum]|uniref:Uncharacterized protein n=1 Tax=Mycena belliarum TaxID=1033014 RepID=A0AAD6UF66_9AGAR|nr:hypothetical protein B0H15DRAFT_1019747 [Mycena belliae]